MIDQGEVGFKEGLRQIVMRYDLTQRSCDIKKIEYILSMTGQHPNCR